MSVEKKLKFGINPTLKLKTEMILYLWGEIDCLLMATEDEVLKFLNEFKAKMSVFQILFRDERKKNTQALLSLEISSEKRKKVIECLEVADFCEGPLDDKLYGIASLWVFGKYIKELELYIKISMGRPNNCVLCVSFHEAEHKMNYPYKK